MGWRCGKCGDQGVVITEQADPRTGDPVNVATFCDRCAHGAKMQQAQERRQAARARPAVTTGQPEKLGGIDRGKTLGAREQPAQDRLQAAAGERVEREDH